MAMNTECNGVFLYQLPNFEQCRYICLFFTENSVLGITTVQLSNPNKHLCWLNACTTALLWARRVVENADHQIPLPSPEDGIEAAILRCSTVSLILG